MIRRRLGILSACAALLAAAAGCGAGAPTAGSSSGASAAPPADATSSATPSAGSAAVTEWLARGGCRAVEASIPAPPTVQSASDANGPTVLTVTGQLRTDAVQPLLLDMATLDAMPQVECSVDDRQAEGRQVVFRGVLLSTLLSSIGARPSAALHTAALNDYAVDLPLSDIADLPVLLATRMDGQPMSVAHYGPLRVVYPTTGYDLDPTIYGPRWIWQLSTIDVA